jgi:para-nitrobenzyl esterase
VDDGQESDGEGGPRTYSGPILDGKLVVETAEDAYEAGRQASVPLIIGNTSAEIGGGFVSTSSSKDNLFSQFGEQEGDAKAAYDPDSDKTFDEVVTKFNTDWVWGEPGRFAARAMVKKGESAYLYHFDYVPSSMRERMAYGAGHGSEVSYVFNTLNARWGASEATPEDVKLAQTMNTYWANFAKTGDPNGEGLPLWPAYHTESEEILDIERNGSTVGKPDPRKARLDVIEKAVELRNTIQSRGGI